MHHVVGAAILIPLVAALPHATLQASNVVVFWKKQVLTLFKPTWSVGSLFPRRAESQSESHLDRTSCSKALVQTVQGVVAQLPVAPNVDSAQQGPTP